ncbi:hypothetical protein ES705_47359 [subsurface metagenome]
MKTREEQIAERREQMPKIHRANYDKAMKGRSMKAATKAFCLECVCWEKEEVRLCTSLACPMYPYRPYKNNSNKRSEKLGFGAESTKLGQGDDYAG